MARGRRIGVLAGTFALASVGAASAAPLEAERCSALTAERDALVATGIREQMAKGVQWAQATLSRDEIARIAAFIALEEQVLFRCPIVRPAPPVSEEAAGLETAESAATGQRGVRTGPPLPVRHPGRSSRAGAPVPALRGSLGTGEPSSRSGSKRPAPAGVAPGGTATEAGASPAPPPSTLPSAVPAAPDRASQTLPADQPSWATSAGNRN